MISVEGSYGDGEENNEGGITGDVDAYSWGVRAEHAFGGGPIAGFLDYHGTIVEEDSNSCCDDALTEHVVLVGLKLNFGTNSLKHHDRYGATFDQPDIGRWTGWSLEQVD